MKKYIKPEIQIYDFDIRTSLMDITPSPSPTPNTFGVVMNNVVSSNMNFIPAEIENKAWSSFESEDWQWYN